MTSGEIGPYPSFPHLVPKGYIETAQKWNERSVKEIKEDINDLRSLVQHLAASAHPDDLIEKAEDLINTLEGRVSQRSSPLKNETAVREIFIREVLDKELTNLKNILSGRKTEKEHNLYDKIALLHQHNQERLLKIKPNDHDAIAFKQLSAIHDNREVIEASKDQPSLSQIQVLDQYKDGTVSGRENCGYHALKNALLALSTMRESMEEVFKDPKLFQIFYQRYCAPLIGEAHVGKRDATIPRLDEIMDLIKTDANPPKELMPMHKVLTDKETVQSVAIFQMTTTTGDDRGDPLMAFLDSRAVNGAKQLYNLAIQPGPRTLSAVFGDESIGHWYTLIIHKDENGELHFLGCDSMDNEHDRVGQFSPLAKMVRLITLALSDPPTLIEKGYAPLDDVISPRSGWIDSDLGDIDPSNVATLLDNVPNVGLATKDHPNKSYQDWVIEHCMLAYDLVELGNWTEKDNFQNSLWMSKLRALTNFYAVHLPTDDPRKGIMETISQRLNDYKLSTIYEPAFEQMKADLEELESQQARFNLTDRGLDRAKFANKHMHTIFNEMDRLADIEDSSQRELAANALTQASGVEPGFFGKGKTEKQRRADLINRTNSLLLTHAIAKKVNKFPEMVQAMGNGDGCLTGVMSRVELFAQELAGLGQIRDTDEGNIAKPIAFVINQVLSRALERMQEQQELPEDEADEIATGWLKQWDPTILSNEALFNDFIATLKIMITPESEAPQAFLFYLLEEGIIHDLHNINWEEVGPKLFDLPQFRDWFIQGRQLTLYDFAM